MVEFRTKKSDTGLVFFDREKFDAFVESLDPGAVVLFRADILGDMKSHEQLGLWYSRILPQAVEAFRADGLTTLGRIKDRFEIDMETTDVSIDLLFKRLWYASLLKEGWPRKADLSKKEMSQLIDFAIYFVASNLGATIVKDTK